MAEEAAPGPMPGFGSGSDEDLSQADGGVQRPRNHADKINFLSNMLADFVAGATGRIGPSEAGKLDPALQGALPQGSSSKGLTMDELNLVLAMPEIRARTADTRATAAMKRKLMQSQVDLNADKGDELATKTDAEKAQYAKDPFLATIDNELKTSTAQLAQLQKQKNSSQLYGQQVSPDLQTQIDSLADRVKKYQSEKDRRVGVKATPEKKTRPAQDSGGGKKTAEYSQTGTTEDGKKWGKRKDNGKWEEIK